MSDWPTRRLVNVMDMPTPRTDTEREGTVTMSEDNYRKLVNDSERLDTLERMLVADGWLDLSRDAPNRYRVHPRGIGGESEGPTLRAAIDAFMDAQQKGGGG